jgi:hypothetical protein
MKTKLNIFIMLFAGTLFLMPSKAIYEAKKTRYANSNSEAATSLIVQASPNDVIEATTQETIAVNASPEAEMDIAKEVVVPTEPTPIPNKASETESAPKQASNKPVTLSRGMAPSISNATSEKAKTTETKTAKTELLDWWKTAQNVFARGDIATVKDVYSGKTFKVQRTMGTNHADAEALTIQDTNIIKSIWGGFSWDRRPVHIYIDGRVLAASMSAMPHAGLDSAPAYAYVKNRSDGYGSGENLDVIKKNGMDGHFDIHFLNSTRHKDGKIDSEHQSTIKIAAGK